jgi:hypothetical protein
MVFVSLVNYSCRRALPFSFNKIIIHQNIFVCVENLLVIYTSTCFFFLTLMRHMLLSYS